MPAVRLPSVGSPGGSRVILWLDAQISPAMAPWLRMRFGIESVAVRDLGLCEAEDPEIFAKAKTAGASMA